MPMLQPMGTLGPAYRQHPAAPLPPPTPVTGEVVHYRTGGCSDNRYSDKVESTAGSVHDFWAGRVSANSAVA